MEDVRCPTAGKEITFESEPQTVYVKMMNWNSFRNRHKISFPNKLLVDVLIREDISTVDEFKGLFFISFRDTRSSCVDTYIHSI